jgi:pantetheine-phosphate adenylyltransferase
VSDATRGSRLGEHAVYPGTFNPITPGHLDIIDRARHLFARVTVLVAVNADKRPAANPSERAIQVRRELPVTWDNVSVAGWAGLTAAFCLQHGAGVIIRGVRNRSDLRHEYQLAAMNQAMGVTTLLLPAQPMLAAVSSRLMRELEPGYVPLCPSELPDQDAGSKVPAGAKSIPRPRARPVGSAPRSALLD